MSRVEQWVQERLRWEDWARIPQNQDPDGEWVFKPDAARLKRYNNDNLPHPETWSP